MTPFPFPYESHFPKLRVNKPVKAALKKTGTHLYTDGKVRENPQVDLGALDGLNFALDDFLGSRKLFGSEAYTLTLDAKPPVSVCKCGSFGGSANWDWNDTRVSLDVCYFAGRELMPRAHER
jgi:hypothetical protein